MKRIILLVLIFCVSTVSYSQQKMISEDRVWEYLSYQYHMEGSNGESVEPYADCSLTRYRFNGTQNVGDKVYNKLYITDKTSWQTPSIRFEEVKGKIENREVNECVALLREEKGKVYILLEGDEVMVTDADYNRVTKRSVEEGEEALLYDFTMTKGEEINMLVDIWNLGNVLAPAQVYECSEIHPEGFPPLKKYNVRNVAFSVGKTYEASLSDNPSWPEDYCDLTIIIDYVEGIGNVGDGNLIDLGTHEYPEPECYCWGGEFFNNLYDLDGNVIYKGNNVNVSDSGSMFKEGRTWRYNAFGTKRHEVGGVSLGVYKVDFDIQAAEETEIDGVKYREFRTTGVSGEYVKYIYSDEDPEERVGSEKVMLDLKPGAPIYMREDNGRIYVRKPSAEPYALRWNVDGNEALVYDLNLTEGQTYDALNLDGDYHEMTLENKGQDLIGGCLPDDEAYVYRYSDSLECLATRNAGFVANGFLSYAGYSNGEMMDTEPEPVCMPDPRFRIDLWLVIDKDGQLVYEPPMGGIEDADLDEDANMRRDADVIYDLNGLRVDRPQRGGVYVRNGKKYIGK